MVANHFNFWWGCRVALSFPSRSGATFQPKTQSPSRPPPAHFHLPSQPHNLTTSQTQSLGQQYSTMAPSVLGKRTRSGVNFTGNSHPLQLCCHTNSCQPDSKPSRVKRQAREEIFNDENESPFLSRSARGKTQDGDSMDIDELSEPIFRTTPAKHGPIGGQIALSPTKIQTRNSKQ